MWVVDDPGPHQTRVVDDPQADAYETEASRVEVEMAWYNKWVTTADVLYTTEMFALSAEINSADDWTERGVGGEAVQRHLAVEDMSVRGFPVTNGRVGITRIEISTPACNGGKLGTIQRKIAELGSLACKPISPSLQSYLMAGLLLLAWCCPLPLCPRRWLTPS